MPKKSQINEYSDNLFSTHVMLVPILRYTPDHILSNIGVHNVVVWELGMST